MGSAGYGVRWLLTPGGSVGESRATVGRCVQSCGHPNLPLPTFVAAVELNKAYLTPAINVASISSVSVSDERGSLGPEMGACPMYRVNCAIPKVRRESS